MRKILCLLFLLFCGFLQAQQPQKLNSSEIFKEIQKSNFLGSALYVAAHPDDENTRLISYLSNELNARTAYLSLTRGDGGQNLIGPEIRELLGVIRTQELLAARQIDGGDQYFTRANDFGYSKTPKETLSIWNEDEILKDVVRAIRKFRPDVIVNRFDANSAGETHGHHTSSAILSKKAFELAGEPSAYPELAQKLGTWQPKKLFFNTSPWFYESQEAFEAADKSNFVQFDTGVYFPILGLSNSEIASLSRSQHKSQGFGSTGSRGREMEYVELLAGEHPKNNDNIFAGINTSWSRVEGGKPIGEILQKVEKNYDFQNPSASLPDLLQAYELIRKLPDPFWREIKLEEIKEVIAASAGLYLEAVTASPLATPGEEVKVNLEAINRSPQQFQLVSVELKPGGKNITTNKPLQNNESWTESIIYQIPENAEFTSPYWLKEDGTLGMYKVEEEELIGLPETPRPFSADFVVKLRDVEIPFKRELVFKQNDPVKGETYKPFEIVPQISLSTASDVLIFANEAPKNINVAVTAMKDIAATTVSFEKLPNWKVEPTSFQLEPLKKGQQKTVTFSVTPSAKQENSIFQPFVLLNGRKFSHQIVQLDYEHIPVQTVVLPAETKIVKLEIEKKGQLIGYIEGAGDVVPQALQQIGYTVEKIGPENISAEKLAKFDAVVMGVRAYNVVDQLRQKQDELLKYVHEGGNLIVQYNTNRGLKTNKIAPYPLELSRDRVTDENAAVTFLAKDHPVLNTPNKITSKDFEGWVQERGLYFPDEWAPEFTPILSMSDEGETAKEGSLLIAPYGKGNYIYTGLSFFREFPAGVPGAFRLFANLISLGKSQPTK